MSPELTEFVGRRAELALVRQALGAARLVTLTGPGGSARPGWPCLLRAVRGTRSVTGWLADVGGRRTRSGVSPWRPLGSGAPGS